MNIDTGMRRLRFSEARISPAMAVTRESGASSTRTYPPFFDFERWSISDDGAKNISRGKKLSMWVDVGLEP